MKIRIEKYQVSMLHVRNSTLDLRFGKYGLWYSQASKIRILWISMVNRHSVVEFCKGTRLYFADFDIVMILTHYLLTLT